MRARRPVRRHPVRSQCCTHPPEQMRGQGRLCGSVDFPRHTPLARTRLSERRRTPHPSRWHLRLNRNVPPQLRSMLSVPPRADAAHPTSSSLTTPSIPLSPTPAYPVSFPLAQAAAPTFSQPFVSSSAGSFRSSADPFAHSDFATPVFVYTPSDALSPNRQRTGARTPDPVNAPKSEPASPSRLDDWDERRLSKTPLMKLLFCNEDQEASMRALYAEGGHVASPYTSRTQARAQEILRHNGLDWKSLQGLESKWKITGTCGRRKRKQTGETVIRAMFQCACGYNTDARQHTLAGTISAQDGVESSWTRRAPYPFTGCLGHADVTFVEQTGRVLRIQGIFAHNAACQTASMVRYPAVPLHPHVLRVALDQLRGNASVSQIRNKNLDMLAAQSYHGQRETLAAEANHRYNLLTSDFRGLYRRHYREHFEVDIKTAPEQNVHNWLDPDSKHFKPAIHKAVFNYAARTCDEERLKVCISTSEMRKAAWRYCHGAQLILDGTFGLCDSRVLLWIAMGVDETGTGVPVALFLFSARAGAQATHGSYDTAILIELIKSWRDWLSLPEHLPTMATSGEPGRIFTPAVAMTDTDTKERGALLAVWPSITLLLCRFHVRQCWTNRRGTVLKSLNGPSRSRIESALRVLEEALLDSICHEDAVQLISREANAYARVASNSAEDAKAASVVKEYARYLQETWMPVDMWHSWTKKGWMDAAALMKVSLDTILTTTNHLESFNGKLKGGHISQWQHSGRRLRFDVLIFHLASSILPRIYARHRVATAYAAWKVERFRRTAGGADLRPSATNRESRNSSGASHVPAGFIPRAWYEPDARRDLEGHTLFEKKHLSPVEAGVMYELWATCQSSQNAAQYYSLTAHPSGAATCTCLDWRKRGGACKHLRAFRMLIETWSAGGALPHKFLFPLTEAAAVDTEQRNHQWYGDAYHAAVSSPSPATPAEPASVSAAAAHGGPTFPSGALCLIPPAHLDDEVPTTSIGAAIELEATVDDDDSVLDPASQASAIPQTSSSGRTDHYGERAVQHQVQAHVEADVAYLLPRLHGLNSTLRGTTHVLTPSDGLVEFHTALEEFRTLYSDRIGPRAHATPASPVALHTTAVAMSSPSPSSTQRTPTKRKVPVLLPPSPEPRQKRKKSHKTS
ncbi:hypothetical protein C8Q77DRAFT_1226560 [Trametes polyzona]|nr:hypothetical protein C8Q77DRAFT_1226560 [Trametes polyzona]